MTASKRCADLSAFTFVSTCNARTRCSSPIWNCATSHPKTSLKSKIFGVSTKTRLEDILHSGQQAGQFAIPDTKIATLAVIAMLNGVMTWYRSGGRLSLDEVEQIYWNMVHKAVTA